LPFASAVSLSRSLFSVQKVPLGVEHSLATGAKPCGLWVDAERARFVRRPIAEMLNSREEWEPRGEAIETSLGELFVRFGERWCVALSLPQTLDRFPIGNLCRLADRKIYGREVPIAMATAEELIVAPVKWLRRIVRERSLPKSELFLRVEKEIPQWSEGGVLAEIVQRGPTFTARLDFAAAPASGVRDSLGKALLAPPERSALPLVCRDCPERAHDETAGIVVSPAFAWRRLGLVEPVPRPVDLRLGFSSCRARAYQERDSPAE